MPALKTGLHWRTSKIWIFANLARQQATTLLQILQAVTSKQFDATPANLHAKHR